MKCACGKTKRFGWSQGDFACTTGARGTAERWRDALRDTWTTRIELAADVHRVGTYRWTFEVHVDHQCHNEHAQRYDIPSRLKRAARRVGIANPRVVEAFFPRWRELPCPDAA